MNMYTPEGTLISTPKNYEYIGSPEGLTRALNRGIILEAQAILCDNRYNLHVELGAKMKGIIPREESQYLRRDEEIKDIAILTRVGKTVCFKVMGFEYGRDGEKVAILSRRAAQRECVENYLTTLIPGDIIPARITHLESFGAFVDVGCGISSLLCIDCISVSRIGHPSARMSVGDTIHTVVKSIDERGRMYVSQKELLGSWEENAELFCEGDTVRGIVRSVENYGIFVELRPNLAGLAEYRSDVYPGQTCAVYIKSIIPDKMKIKLIIIDSHDSPELEYSPPQYFVDTERVTHLDSWQYSPPGCKKIIETIFS